MYIPPLCWHQCENALGSSVVMDQSRAIKLDFFIYYIVFIQTMYIFLFVWSHRIECKSPCTVCHVVFLSLLQDVQHTVILFFFLLVEICQKTYQPNMIFFWLQRRVGKERWVLQGVPRKHSNRLLLSPDLWGWMTRVRNYLSAGCQVFDGTHTHTHTRTHSRTHTRTHLGYIWHTHTPSIRI